MKKNPTMKMHDVEPNLFQMNSSMRYHSERIMSGDSNAKLESIAIFELAASDHLIFGEGDHKYIPANEDLLLQQYPEYSSQISQSFEIRQCFLRQYNLPLQNQPMQEHTNNIANIDYSFFTSIHNYYKNNPQTNSNNDVTAQVLNFYTSKNFQDQPLTWWFDKFEKIDSSTMFIGRKSFHSIHDNANRVKFNFVNE